MGTVVWLFQMKEISLAGEIQSTCSWHVSQKLHRSVGLGACSYTVQFSGCAQLKIAHFSLLCVLLTVV